MSLKPTKGDGQKPITLEHLLFTQGFGTRKQCQQLCKSGFVEIDNQVQLNPKMLLTPGEGMPFSVDGQNWPYYSKAYIALHKPEGYECSQKPQHHQSIFSLFPSPLKARKIQAAGRLDVDTTGLIFLSDDGQFIHAIASAKRNVPKTYCVTTKHPVTPQMVQQLLAGVLLHGEDKPSIAIACLMTGEHELELTIDTGIYHQVKRMIAAAGNRVEKLHRKAIGNYQLPATLMPGQWLWLTPNQIPTI